MTPRRRGPRDRGAAAALVASGLLAGLILVEVALRLSGLHLARFWRSDPLLGLGLRPGVSGWFIEEGRAFVSTDASGHHDRERTREKPPGTYRVLVLGDSFTEAVQVPLDDAFEQVAKRRLAASCPALKGRTVQVMNWGVRGFGTADELALLKLDGESYSPDAVVVADYPETDLLDNLRPWNGPTAEPLILERDGRLEFTARMEEARRLYAEALRASGQESFPENLWLVQLVEGAWNHWRRRAFWKRGKGNDPTRPDYPAAKAYSPPADETWTRAWNVQEDLLDLFARETAANGIRPLLMVVSSPAQVLPDPAERARFARLWGSSDMGYPSARLSGVARRLGLPFLDTVPPLLAKVERTGRPVHGFPNSPVGFGHWNPAGHAVVGEALGEKLCALASAPRKAR